MQVRTQITKKLIAIGQLSRWRQHVPYTLPLVIAGALLAAFQADASVDWRLLAVVLANVLAMSFAFMINDVIDAPDDASHPSKRKRNVVSSGVLSYRAGKIISGVVFVLSAILYGFGGWLSFLVGLSTLVLCYLYSVPPFRLKARPVVDVLSHVLMLSAFLMLSGYVIYDTAPHEAWWVIAAVTFASAYGQFYNQHSDFEVDKSSGLQTTAILLGQGKTQVLMGLSATLTVLCMGVAIYVGVCPGWLGWILAVTVITLGLFEWRNDMRGDETDPSGSIQKPVLIAANIVVFVWLLSTLGLLPMVS